MIIFKTPVTFTYRSRAERPPPSLDKSQTNNRAQSSKHVVFVNNFRGLLICHGSFSNLPRATVRPLSDITSVLVIGHTGRTLLDTPKHHFTAFVMIGSDVSLKTRCRITIVVHFIRLWSKVFQPKASSYGNHFSSQRNSRGGQYWSIKGLTARVRIYEREKSRRADYCHSW